MNITLLISSLYGGGSERVTCNLASYLAEQGNAVEILTMAETEKSYELNSNVTVCTLLSQKERKNKIWNTVVRFPRLWKYLVTHKEKDVYIVMLPKTIMLFMAFKWMTKAKVIISERGNPGSYSKKTQKALQKCASVADGLVFQTIDVQKWYEQYTRNIPTIVIPNAINEKFIRPIFEGDRKKEIVAVGRLNKQKNFELLIKAFAQISGQFPEYTLTIYGEGDEREQLESLICSLNLQQRIEMPGNVFNVAERIERASLFVLSSNYEGMPNALMEAMALGIPCISTDCPAGGSRFLINNNKNGILVPLNDEKEMAKAIRDLLSDEKKANDLGKKAAIIQDVLAPQKIYEQWEKFISNVLLGEKL